MTFIYDGSKSQTSTSWSLSFSAPPNGRRSVDRLPVGPGRLRFRISNMDLGGGAVGALRWSMQSVKRRGGMGKGSQKEKGKGRRDEGSLEYRGLAR